jgi:hypothetical protein
MQHAARSIAVHGLQLLADSMRVLVRTSKWPVANDQQVVHLVAIIIAQSCAVLCCMVLQCCCATLPKASPYYPATLPANPN